jgi:hypothetical protein
MALGLGKVHAPYLEMESLFEEQIAILCAPAR